MSNMCTTTKAALQKDLKWKGTGEVGFKNQCETYYNG